MKTAIVYASVHHGNTKKIIDEIAKTNDVELIDATQTVEKDLAAAVEFYNGLTEQPVFLK